jgi:hypothetical protein
VEASFKPFFAHCTHDPTAHCEPVNPPPSVPEAMTADSDWWRAVIDLASCKAECDICSFFRPNDKVKCAKALGVILSTPMNNLPYEQALMINSAQMQALLVSLNENNQLRRLQEIRENPLVKWTSVMLGALLIVVIQQAFLFVVSMI